MARIDVDKRATQPGYQADIIKFQAMRDELAPLFVEYFRIKDPDIQAAWLALDPLMAQVVDFCKKVEAGKDVS